MRVCAVLCVLQGGRVRDRAVGAALERSRARDRVDTPYAGLRLPVAMAVLNGATLAGGGDPVRSVLSLLLSALSARSSPSSADSSVCSAPRLSTP